MTSKENYLLAARGGKGEYVPDYIRDVNAFNFAFRFTNPDGVTPDMFGVVWTINDAGPMPHGGPVMTDIHQWRELVHFPPLAEMDWEGWVAEFMQTYDPDKITTAGVPSSLFLAAMNMMGWVEGLCAVGEEPEEMEAFVSYIADYAVESVDYLCRYVKPDIIGTGDDIANNWGPFVSRESWEQIYKPHFQRIVDAIHAHGALCEFHNCGRNQWLIDECMEMGVDILNLPEPADDLREARKKYGNRLVITGGWDRHGEGCMPDASEEVVRRSVHTALDEWGKDGAFIFWDGGIVGTSQDSQNKMKWVTDEFDKYRYEIYK